MKFRYVMTAVFALLCAALIGACGGGGSDEEPEQQTPEVDCKAKPEPCK